ncbi:MAG: metallophosphoesterase [Clostridia bacterium]|nr:metallophosphoesterase [Clostridia bacterium]
MKTAVVLSDTHGNTAFLEKLFPLFRENDYIIHLGDGNRDMSEIFKAFPEKTFVCQGNCDFSTEFSQSEWELEIENCKIFCTHGHRYGVKSGLNGLKQEAMQRGCQVALYGHTHCAELEKDGDVLVCNPGNGKRYSVNPSYGYLVVNQGKATFTVVPVLP